MQIDEVSLVCLGMVCGAKQG